MSDHDGLKTYFADAGRLYRPGESRLLVEEWNNILKANDSKDNDSKAIDLIKKHLIENHQLLVVERANYFSKRYNVSLGDLIGEGNIGLLKAAEKFNPTLGFQFYTFAQKCIDTYMFRYCQKEMNRVAKPSDAEDAALWLDLHPHGDPGKAERKTIQLITQHEIETALDEVMKKLSARDANIIRLRFLTVPGKTLEEIAAIVQLSRERVSQIIDGVLEKLRKGGKVYKS